MVTMVMIDNDAVGWKRWVVASMLVVLQACLVDCLYNEPCSLWPGSYHWRGVCWKILPQSVSKRSAIAINHCQIDYNDANPGIPVDQPTLLFLSTLISPGDEPLVWGMLSNWTVNTNSQILVADPNPNSEATSSNCTALNVTEGLMQDTPCGENLRISCFLEVGNPCSSSSAEGDLYVSSCLFLGQQQTSWVDAKIDCEIKGGYLVDIQDVQERDFVTEIVSLLNLNDPVLVGARENSPNVWEWELDGDLVLDVLPSDANMSCLALTVNGSYTPVDCDEGGYNYICEQATTNYQYFIHIPEAVQTDDIPSKAYVTLSTSSQLVNCVIEVWDNGTIINSTSYLVPRQYPVIHRIDNVLDLVLTPMDISSKAIHVTTAGKSQVSFIYSRDAISSSDITIYPYLFLDTYYVISGVRLKGDNAKSYLSVIATDSSTTTVSIYFALRFVDTVLKYKHFEVISPGYLRFDLEKFQSVLIESDNDLSGATVTADKPVAVFSGNKQVNWGGSESDVMTQMVPFRHVTNDYLVLVPSDVYSVTVAYRLTATEKASTIYIIDETVPGDPYERPVSYNQIGAIRDILLEPGSFVSFNSSAPFILVSIGPYDVDTPTANHPYIVPVPSIHQYRDHYLFNPQVLLQDWTNLWLGVVGINININDSDTIQINSQSIQDFAAQENIAYNLYGEDNNRSRSAVVLKITDRFTELSFESMSQNCTFYIMIYWDTTTHSFCRLLEMEIAGMPDQNASYTLTTTFEETTTSTRSAIMWERDWEDDYYYCSGGCGGSSGGGDSIVDSGGGGDDGGGGVDDGGSIDNNQTTTIRTTQSTNDSLVSHENATTQPTTTNSLNVTMAVEDCLGIPEVHNLSESEVQELVKDIHRRLFIDPKGLSAFNRKYVSVSDPRPSSTTMGVLGIMTFSVMVISLLIPDMITFSLFVFKWAKIFKLKYYG